MGKENKRRICIDTDVSIALIKNLPPREHIMELIIDRSICMSSVSAFELLLRKTNLDLVESFISKMEIIDFDFKSARIASTIAKTLVQNGIGLEGRDLFIAATSISHECELLTLNKKDFENVPGISLVEF